MKSENWQITEWIKQPNRNKIRTVKGKETYQYLGILKADIIKQVEKKEKFKRIAQENGKLLETKLYSRNHIKWINNWAVSLVRFTGPFLKWTRK